MPGMKKSCALRGAKRSINSSAYYIVEKAGKGKTVNGNRVKKRIFAGSTADQIVYTSFSRTEGGTKEPRIRFKNEEERAEHNRQVARRHCARLINTNCTPAGYYCTLTFDNEHELHTFEEARKIRSNFRRRLLYRCPEARVFIFMGRGKSTSRIHFHVIAENVTPEAIANAWTGGEIVEIKHLRANNKIKDENGERDIGADFTAVSNYCFDHWTPEQGGHYYCRAGDIRQPEEEEPTICIREYSLTNPPLPPKGYVLVSSYATSYGFLYFHYVKKPVPKGRKSNLQTFNIKC